MGSQLIVQVSKNDVIVQETIMELAVYPNVITGTASQATITTHVAGQNVSALRIVRGNGAGKVVYASNDTINNAKGIAGLTLSSALNDQNVSVQIAGEISDNSWSWTEGDIWLGADGVLTQTVPTSGIHVCVARAITATKIIVDIEPLILLG